MLLTMSKTLNSTCISRLHCHFSSAHPTQRFHIQLRRLFNAEFQSPKPFNSISYSSNSLRCLCAAVSVPPIRSRLQCVTSSAASFASAAGGGRGIRGSGGGGGGDGASDSGEAKSNSVVGGSEDVSALSPNVIILDVGGMTCGGCAASVKRILESQVSELKAAIGPLSGRSLQYCTDACLRRYLEARNWNVGKAKKMLEETLQWRSTYKPEEICWVLIFGSFTEDEIKSFQRQPPEIEIKCIKLKILHQKGKSF